MTGSFIIEALAPGHDRAEFTCGVDVLDRYFQRQAGQDVRRRVTACFVSREIATDRIAGYYTSSAGGVLADLPAVLPSVCHAVLPFRLRASDALPSLSHSMALNLGAPSCGMP